MQYSQAAKCFVIIYAFLSHCSQYFRAIDCDLTPQPPPTVNIETICCARLHIEINNGHFTRLNTVLTLPSAAATMSQR